jgi:hypothetical protein
MNTQIKGYALFVYIFIVKQACNEINNPDLFKIRKIASMHPSQTLIPHYWIFTLRLALVYSFMQLRIYYNLRNFGTCINLVDGDIVLISEMFAEESGPNLPNINLKQQTELRIH